MARAFWPAGKPVPEVGQVWRRKRNGRLVTVTRVPNQQYWADVEYDMGGGKAGGTWTGNWHHAFELVGEASGPAIPASESVSQQITRLLGTDDWAILHSGHKMVTDVELDEIEAGR